MRLSLIALAMVSAPVSAQVYSDPYGVGAVASFERLSLPIGGEVTAAAGDALISTARFREVSGARLLDPASSAVTEADPLHVPAGSDLYAVSTSKAYKACTTFLNRNGWPTCLIDDDGDGTFDRIARNDISKATPVVAKAGYQRGRTVRIPPIAPGFQRTILYQGGTADSLQFSYRESSDDYARPAFEEKLTIPIGGSLPQRFAIKGLIFTATKLDGLGLTATLDSVDASKGWPTQ